MAFPIWPFVFAGAFGYFVGLLPRRLGWTVFGIGYAIYLIAGARSARSFFEGLAEAVALGIFLAIPFFAGWAVAMMLRYFAGDLR